MSPDDDPRRNAILGRLPKREHEAVRARLDVVDTDEHQQVYQPGGPITEVHFPLSSVFSLVALADDGRVVVEVATTGYEGMVGLPLFLGATSSPLAAFCQIPGRSARMSATDLRTALASNGSLHGGLSRFTQAHLVQVAQNVVCNNTHSVQQRAARWLLTSHDRVGRDEFPLTQQFLAQMLGARRPTVSDTARKLQAGGLIQYRRGIMTIIDRPGLESHACACYAIVKAEFEPLTGRR